MTALQDANDKPAPTGPRVYVDDTVSARPAASGSGASIDVSALALDTSVQAVATKLTGVAQDTSVQAVGAKLTGVAQDTSVQAITAKLGTTLTVSDQDAVAPAGSPFSASAAGVLFTIDTTGYDTLAVDVASIGTGNTLTFYGSNDGTFWTAKVFDRTDTNSGSTSSLSTTAPIVFGCEQRFIRATITTYGSGTVTANTTLRSTTARARGVYVNGGAITANAAKLTTGGLTQTAFRTPLAGANPTVVKNAATTLYAYSFSNVSTGWRYIHLFNQTTAPTMGTNSDARVIAIPPGGTVSYQGTDIGIAFSSGLCIAVTTAAAANDNSVSGIAVGDVVGMLDYA